MSRRITGCLRLIDGVPCLVATRPSEEDPGGGRCWVEITIRLRPGDLITVERPDAADYEAAK